MIGRETSKFAIICLYLLFAMSFFLIFSSGSIVISGGREAVQFLRHATDFVGASLFVLGFLISRIRYVCVKIGLSLLLVARFISISTTLLFHINLIQYGYEFSATDFIIVMLGDLIVICLIFVGFKSIKNTGK